MSHTVKYFMWGYQPHFQISMEVAARDVFGKLDKRLCPDVFLVGVLAEDRDDRYPICIEPDDHLFTPDDLTHTVERARAIHSQDEDADILISDPGASVRYRRRIEARALSAAIATILNESAKAQRVIYHVSQPVSFAGYDICLALGLQAEEVAAYYSLKKKKRDRFNVKVSLIDATVSEFFHVARSRLEQMSPEEPSLDFGRDSEEVIRAAGKSLMYTPGWATRALEGMHNLYTHCNVISSLKYEGETGGGDIIIARKDHPSVSLSVAFRKPMSMQSCRAARKALELTSDNEALLTDTENVFGLAGGPCNYDASAEDLFVVRILGHHLWELTHDGHCLMRVNHGLPSLPRDLFDENKFFNDMPRFFRGISDKEKANLLDLVRAVAEVKHGAMLVITPEAQQEAERLSSQSTPIEPCTLNPELLNRLSTIDGAVLLEPCGTCHAIGVILDGLATPKGDPGRGARYNSAVRYVETVGRSCMAVVISEDGGVDVVPDLMPQIPRAWINEPLDTLREMGRTDSTDRKTYYRAMDQLGKLRFYLLPDVCNELNALWPEIDNRVHAQDNGFRLLRDDFSPDPQMNKSYFLD